MSVALALYYIFRRLEGVQALPFPDTEGNTMSTCDDINNCRTTSDIVWSCLTTVFTCTWVAIHPNIPAPYESSFEIGLRRLGIVIMALIAPELVIAWAMRQWLVSRRLAREHQSKDWTQTHGFFALTGGFMLFDRGKALCTLNPEKLDELYKEGKIEFPAITKKEIEDKSKGDAISKGFVLVQTSWFVLQCVARGVEHLPITELEIVTLAFAVLNMATYALWWNKPQNVRCPFPVHLSDAGSPHAHGTGELDEASGFFRRSRQATSRQWKESSDVKAIRGFIFLILPFANMIRWKTPSTTGAKKVSSFYAGENDSETWTAGLASVAVAVVFGAIHCVAWSFHFPSQEKEILWRACSVAITCLPVAVVLLGILASYLNTMNDRHGNDVAGVVAGIFFRGIAIWAVVAFPVIYIVCRAILLIEAFILLKALPSGAFQTVQWTNFIPHV